MKLKLLKLSYSSGTLVLAMSLSVQAQGAVDMKKFTCEQLLTGTANANEAAI